MNDRRLQQVMEKRSHGLNTRHFDCLSGLYEQTTKNQTDSTKYYMYIYTNKSLSYFLYTNPVLIPGKLLLSTYPHYHYSYKI